MSSGLGEVLRYAHKPFFGSKLASRMCNLPNIAVTPASSSAVAGRGDSVRALVTGVTGSDVTKSIDKTAPKALTDGTTMWEEDDGFVYYKGRLYVPNDRSLRKEVVKTCHDAVTTGHPGKNGTIELVSRYYWWPRMGGFITAYVDGCDKCQRYRRD